MGKQLTATTTEMSDALHALAYALGQAKALRTRAARGGDGSTRRALSRYALTEYLVNAPLPYKDRDQLAVSYGQGYRDQCDQPQKQG